jgi:hypothetical protein
MTGKHLLKFSACKMTTKDDTYLFQSNYSILIKNKRKFYFNIHIQIVTMNQ